VNSSISNVVYSIANATGANVSGLSAGLSGNFAAGVFTISGTPSVSGNFNYTVTTTGGCNAAAATGTVTVNPLNTIAAGTNQTLCVNTALTSINLATTGATGATFTGLPAGVTGVWSGNTAAISGTPTASGTFNYSVTTTGGCPPASTTGTITVTPQNTIVAGTSQTLCVNTALTSINLVTTGATGATFTGLPAGVTGVWSGNTATISGTPTVSGTFNYTVTTTGGCPPASTTGTITATPQNTIVAGTSQTLCVNTALTSINLATSGATGATFTGLPAGVTGVWSGNTATISGTPTASGSFNYTVTTTGGCPPASTTGTINVTPQNTIAAGTSQTLCVNTALTSINLATTGATGATFTGLPAGVTGVWSGNTATISGTPTASGTFNYTVTTTGGCTSVSTSGSITVNQLTTPTFTALGPYCSPTSIPSLPTTSLNGISGTWFLSLSNTSTQNYTFTPTTIAVPTCATGTSMSITINPTTVPQFNAIGPFCAGAIIPSLPTTSLNGISGSWSSVVSNTSSGIYTFTPTTNGVPNCASTATMSVTINPVVNPVFTQLGPYCQNSSPGILPSVSNNSVDGTWSPSIVNTTFSGNQTYTFTPGPNVCANPTSMTITINQPTQPTFSAINPICAGGVILLPSNSLNGVSGSWIPAVNNAATTTYTFNPSAGICASGATTTVVVNPLPQVLGTDQVICAGEQVILSGTGASIYAWSGGVQNGVPFSPIITTTYILTGTSVQGCVNTDQVTVTVNPLPTVNAGVDISVCENGTVTLLASGASTYVWSNNVLNGVTFVPPTGVTTFTVTGTSQFGCSNNDDVTVTTFSAIPVDFAPNLTQGCAPFEVDFSNLNLNGNECEWTFGDGSSSTDCGNVTHTYTAAGCYDVSLTVISSNGCVGVAQFNNLICVEEAPEAYFIPSASNETTTNPVFSFTNMSDDATSYFWDFGDNIGSSQLSDPTYTYSDQSEGSYLVTLVASTDFGCIDTAQGFVQVFEELLYYVPNSFTPDGDTYNQTFKPIFTSGFDPEDYHLMIFNRWGELIFESYNNLIGWDGTYGKNKEFGLCPDGTYTYVIEFKISKNDSRRNINGSLSLIR
jgi:gliding motility-associated-like protein